MPLQHSVMLRVGFLFLITPPDLKFHFRLLLQLNDAYEEVDEQRQSVASWKRKAQKAQGEANDIRKGIALALSPFCLHSRQH